MEVKIGVQNVARELSIDVDDSPETVLDNLAKTGEGVFTLSNSKGETVAVPGDKVAYVLFQGEVARKIGFA